MQQRLRKMAADLEMPVQRSKAKRAKFEKIKPQTYSWSNY
jgi:hypothetical protein